MAQLSWAILFQDTQNMQNNQHTYERAYCYCISILSKRDYSEFQLRRKLKEKGHEEFIEEVITKLHEQKYIQEDQFRRSRIKALIHKGYSSSYISQKLEGERLSTSIEFIKSVYDELQTNEQNQKKLLIEKKMRLLNKNDSKTQEKLIRFLASKGHQVSYCELESLNQESSK